MMKEQFLQYEEPTIEVIRFTEQDVIRTSGFSSGKNTEGEFIPQESDDNYVFRFNK